MKKRIPVVLLTVLLLLLLCACSNTPNSAVLHELIPDTTKASFSYRYTTLSAKKRNSTNAWRQGMVSGNGMQGFVESGDPYSDSFIFQNMYFIMPNVNVRYCPVTSDELEPVRQAIVKGENITDNASYDDVYRFHPGGALRLELDGKGKRDYIRYTDYLTSQVGVYFQNNDGNWLRTSFTSMADDAVITKLRQSTDGEKLNLTLSFDDLSTMANFGASDEANLLYQKIASDNADCLSLVAHYPDYENSELRNGGYATLTYVVTVGGTKEKVELPKATEETQFCGDNCGIRIAGAEEVYLITLSGRTAEMGSFDAFKDTRSFALVDELYKKTAAVAERYGKNGGFDYDAALQAHLAIYSPQFDAVSLSLGDGSALPNETLLAKQKGKNQIRVDLAARTYYAGRYAYLCAGGVSTPRLYGMWTGEFNTGWGSKYTMDANVNLQTSSLNTGNMPRLVDGYVNFLLRQMPDWEENAKATHGFDDAIQAPVNADGDKAVITETCYPYPFRYWNAGASWMLQPLFESWLCFGDLDLPVSDAYDLDALRSVLSPAKKDLTDAQLDTIRARGTMKLTRDILLPLLEKSVNYWKQLLTPEYYTDKDGGIHFEAGKTSLAPDEYYCILPSYSPENNPANYPSPSDANCAIDIAACRDNLRMLRDIRLYLDKNADTSDLDALLDKLPPYLFDDSGALKEWATTLFDENNEHRHLSHLYCVWPLFETQRDDALKNACLQAIANRESENEASHALVHRALIAARLKDSESFTDALLKLMNHRIRYDSLMTNHDYDRGSCYCTDFCIGYLGMIHESLVYSDENSIELLPSVALSGFQTGEIRGLRTRCRAVVQSMQWDLDAGIVSATIVSQEDRTITVRCPRSDESHVLECKANVPVAVTFDLG